VLVILKVVSQHNKSHYGGNYMRSGKNKRGKSENTYNKALRVLGIMRRTGKPLNAAAREEHMDPRTVRKHVRAELRGRGGNGCTKPTKSDRRARRMLIPTALGASPVKVRGSKQASLLGRYMSAVGQYLRTGDTEALKEFEGKTISGNPLITDPQTLTALAQAGSLQLDQIYALSGASS
jgi:hypothetical protein